MTQFGKRLAPAAEAAALMPQTFPARLLLPGGEEREPFVVGHEPLGATGNGEEIGGHGGFGHSAGFLQVTGKTRPAGCGTGRRPVP